MDGIARVMYDLAILMTKYDSYLEWKSMNETQKTTEIAAARSEKIEYKNVTNTVEKIENDDMNNVLDGIWIE
jgi:phage terminase Nu1 subunit (DNA packaging protein)